MDLLSSFRTQATIDAVRKTDDRPTVYVGPLPRQGVPSDGAVEYSTVVCLTDVTVPVKSGHCFLFSEDADSLSVLRILNDYPNVLPFRVRRLEGMSGVEYPAGFLRDSWALEAEQYFNLVTAAAEAKQADAAEKKKKADSSKAVREQQARTRLSGHTREFRAFDVVGPNTEDQDVDVGAAD